MDLNIKKCDKDALISILNDIKPILKKSRILKKQSKQIKQTAFETKHRSMIKIIKDYIQEIENELIEKESIKQDSIKQESQNDVENSLHRQKSKDSQIEGSFTNDANENDILLKDHVTKTEEIEEELKMDQEESDNDDEMEQGDESKEISEIKPKIYSIQRECELERSCKKLSGTCMAFISMQLVNIKWFKRHFFDFNSREIMINIEEQLIQKLQHLLSNYLDLKVFIYRNDNIYRYTLLFCDFSNAMKFDIFAGFVQKELTEITFKIPNNWQPINNNKSIENVNQMFNIIDSNYKETMNDEYHEKMLSNGSEGIKTMAYVFEDPFSSAKDLHETYQHQIKTSSKLKLNVKKFVKKLSPKKKNNNDKKNKIKNEDELRIFSFDSNNNICKQKYNERLLYFVIGASFLEDITNRNNYGLFGEIESVRNRIENNLNNSYHHENVSLVDELSFVKKV